MRLAKHGYSHAVDALFEQYQTKVYTFDQLKDLIIETPGALEAILTLKGESHVAS